VAHQKSAHVVRSDYQIRCRKRARIIKLDTRYQIECKGKLLKHMKPILVFKCSVTALVKIVKHAHSERDIAGGLDRQAAFCGRKIYGERHCLL
jgi:hypothetical protein